jgi:hypothetical protein
MLSFLEKLESESDYRSWDDKEKQPIRTMFTYMMRSKPQALYRRKIVQMIGC